MFKCAGCNSKYGWGITFYPCGHEFHPRCLPTLPIDGCHKCKLKVMISSSWKMSKFNEIITDANINKTLRKGKWTSQEKQYGDMIVQALIDNFFPIPFPISLRSILATLLNCEPMRVTRWCKTVQLEKERGTESRIRIKHKFILWKFMRKFSIAEEFFLTQVRNCEGEEMYRIVTLRHEIFWRRILHEYSGNRCPLAPLASNTGPNLDPSPPLVAQKEDQTTFSCTKQFPQEERSNLSPFVDPIRYPIRHEFSYEERQILLECLEDVGTTSSNSF